MKSHARRRSVSVAVILCALLCLPVAGPGVATAQTTPVTTSGTTAPGFGSTDPAAAATTTSTVAPGNPNTTSATVAPPDTSPSTTFPVVTTVAPSTTSTTLSAAQLNALIQSLGTDVAQAQAVGDYLAARALAASLAASSGAGPLPGGADPVLVQAAAAQLQAGAEVAAAQQRFAQARHRIGLVAVALYLGEQVPSAGSNLAGSQTYRSEFLAGVLDAEQDQAKAATVELTRATAAANERRRQADRLVQSRTVELQTAALQAAAAARAQAALTGGAVASSGAGTGAGTGAGATGGAPVAGNALRPGGIPGGAAPSLVTQESPTILGPAVLSADELAGWFSGSGRRASLTVSLPVLAADFESAGAVAGVRADIAFAQSVLETGYFSFPGFGQVRVADNNFAGIGACDSCGSGFHFPDALTGVTAQMQLLHAYATTSQPVPGPLPGPFRVSGCCPTWMQLTGVWATASDYGIKILKLYLSMVQWALARRTAAAQL
jgi:hypothetical protein